MCICTNDCVDVITTGGYDGNNFLSSIECYDVSEDRWTQEGNMACGRSGHGVAVSAEPSHEYAYLRCHLEHFSSQMLHVCSFVRSFIHQVRWLTVGSLSTCLQLSPALRPRHGPVRISPLTLRLVLYIYRA